MGLQPKPFEIFEARVDLGKATYPRPYLIMVLEKHGDYLAYPISSALELCDTSTYNFRIDSTDPDFSKTGLKKDCYVLAERLKTVRTVELIRKRGQLEGDLLQRFKKWID